MRLLEEEDYSPDGESIEINLMPPNDNGDTDEDSGNEENVDINNLPGSQLLVEAEINRSILEEDEEWYEDDLIPLSQLAKKSKVEVLKKKYKWVAGGLNLTEIESEWPEISTAENNNTPLELFQRFFDSEVIDMLVSYTNMYAARKNQKYDITVEEIETFIGILLLSGYNSQPRRRMYWENARDSHNEAVSEGMSRNRFEHILTNLHCCDNNVLDPSDKFSKVRPLFSKLNERFLKFAPLEQNHCVDEAMVPYFGRHGCKQFIRGKPLRYGYKLWVGATSKGYIVWYEPYQGAKSEIKECYRLLGLGPSVVLQYVDILLSSSSLPFSLFFDNFFSSLPLIDELTKRKIKASGTIRKNRIKNYPLPPDGEMKKNRGSYAYKVTEDRSTQIIKWSDNSIVHMISNFFGLKPLHPVTRFSQKEKKRISVFQPHSIYVYNKCMGGVDRSDQNIGLYRIGIRGKKWYFPLIAHLIDAAEQNAWQLHRQQNGKLDHLGFRRHVALSLLQKNTRNRAGNLGQRFTRPSQFENKETRFDGFNHFVTQQEKQTRCRVCHNKVSTKCIKCDVALHVKCFIAYHTK